MIENKEKIICFCLGTTEDTIVDAVRKGAHSLKTIKEMTKACTGDQCEELNPKDRCCSKEIIEIIKKESGKSDSDCECCK